MRDKTPQPQPGRGGDGRRVGLLYLANVLFGAGLFSHAFLYNFYLEALGLGAAVMGGAAASLTAGGLVALIPAGRLVDAVGAGRTYLVACVLAFSGLAFGAAASSAQPVYAAAFVAGLGTATWRVSMGPLLMRVAPPGTRSRAFSWNVALLLASGSVWTALSGFLPGWLERTSGLSAVGAVRVALVTGAALSLLSAAPLLAGGVGPVAAVPASQAAFVRQGLLVAGALRLPARVMVFVGVVAVWMAAAGLVLPFFNMFFLREYGLGVSRIGVLFGATQAVTALVVFASGVMAGRAGARRVLLAWAATFAPLLWGLALAAAAPLAVLLFLLQGFAPPATNPLIDQLLLERTPPERHGAVSTWRNAATELSGLAGAAAGGALLQATSFGMLFTVAGSVALVGLAGLGWALGRLPATPVPAVAARAT